MLEKIYNTPTQIIAGITEKDQTLDLDGSMALHTGDEFDQVMANRYHFANQHHIDIKQLVFANQTHSANIKYILPTDAGSGALSLDNAIKDTDALYTFDTDIMLTSLTADCVPIIFWSTTDHLIGTIHSGWRGTIQEVTLKTFSHILAHHPQIDISQIQVHLGASISQTHFEVDQDVANQFRKLGYASEWINYNSETAKYHIDNQAIVAEQCRQSGIDPVNIQMDPSCTFASEEGFSYRENKTSGRHTSFIMQK